MKKLKWILSISVVILLMLSGTVLALTAEEIMKKVEDFQYADSVKMEVEMLIVNGKRQMTKTMTLLSRDSSALVEFTNPRDRGTKFLKIEDDLWMYFPDAEEVIKISGHMLEQGMMGSDFSYQDAMESEKLTELYDYSIIREEELDGRSCYVVEGIAKEGAKVSYYRRVSWIDKERFVILKEELYAQSGKLLKLLKTKKVEKIDGRWYVTESVMENKLRRNTRTEFRILSIEFNPEIPEDTFSLHNLR
ncbi:outer membrane lipoprotein-sorting protein [Anoxybacter fermentans]|uniref:Outer membrane lipoprotein-sorting protein n=1 Tax=Anoxybacter fermentans TaxID=1323375 RepID=A0A3S9SV68_9FIRM|nr:outer membrane lipoprotein-sorting protein [Anoxybacter fermentans]AZR72178.1 outer membrane lipoprotein-sorting protein [Anoxybacter fermentans]